MQVQLITPEKILFEGDVTYVQIPGIMGEFGVLPNHAPFISTLCDGNITITLAKDEKRDFHITSGVAEVLPDRVTLLVETD